MENQEWKEESDYKLCSLHSLQILPQEFFSQDLPHI